MHWRISMWKNIIHCPWKTNKEVARTLTNKLPSKYFCLKITAFCNEMVTQIQKYFSNKKIIQNYAQMKYKWPVTAIKPLKNKLFSVTSNPFTLVYFMSSKIQFHSWLNLLTAARFNQTWFKKYFPVSLSTIYNIKREDIMLEILYSSTIKR